MTTFEPESVMQYSSSGPLPQALIGTVMAPMAAAAQKAIDHSGKLRMAMATRSPLPMPKRSV